MATSINVGYALWLDGETFNALLGRTFDIAPMAYVAGSGSATAVRGGVLPSGGTAALQVKASSGMNVTVNPGYCVVANSTSALYGAYRFGLLSQGTLTVTTSDPTNPRIDLVVAQVTDNGDSTSFAQVELVTGTAAPIPAAPAAPANSITLAQIAVAAGATSIVSGNITDKRIYTVPPGGVLPVSQASAAPTGQNGSYIHDLTTGRLLHNGSTGPQQAHLLPWSPVTASRTSLVASSSAFVTVLSSTITTDGSTDIEVTTKWGGVNDAGSVATAPVIEMGLFIDGTQVDQVFVYVQVVSGALSIPAFPSGGCSFYRTMGSLGTTPSSGSHTIAWKMKPWDNGGDSLQIVASTTSPMQMVIKPVML